MNSIEKNVEIESRKVIFSTVWIFAILNYISCDIIGYMDAEMIKKILSGELMSFPTTQEFWLGLSILMEIPIVIYCLRGCWSTRPTAGQTSSRAGL